VCRMDRWVCSRQRASDIYWTDPFFTAKCWLSQSSPIAISFDASPTLYPIQSTHEERQGAETSAEPGVRTTKSPLQRTLTTQIMGLWTKHSGVVERIGVK